MVRHTSPVIQARRKAGLTQANLAGLLEMGERTLRRRESRPELMSVQTLLALAAVCHVSPRDLLDEIARFLGIRDGLESQAGGMRAGSLALSGSSAGRGPPSDVPPCPRSTGEHGEHDDGRCGTSKKTQLQGGDISVCAQLACAGDKAAINSLVQHLAPCLTTKAERSLPPEMRAAYGPRDLVQDTWMAALPRLSHFKPQQGSDWVRPLIAFLVQTMRNLARNATRSANRRAAGESPVAQVQDKDSAAGGVAAAARSPADTLAKRSAMVLVREILDSLGSGDKEIIQLRFFDGLCNKEVAEHLGITPNAASKRFLQALERAKALVPGWLAQDLVP